MLMSLDACTIKRRRQCLLNEVMFFLSKRKEKDFYYLPICCLNRHIQLDERKVGRNRKDFKKQIFH